VIIHPSLLLKLVTAHLLGDFVLQPTRWAREKRRPSIMARHLAVHAVLLTLIALSEPYSIRLLGAFALALAAHLAIDSWSIRRGGSVAILVVDQGLHLGVLALVAWMAGAPDVTDLMAGLGRLVGDGRNWAVGCAATLAIPVGAVVVERWLTPFRDKLWSEPEPGRAGLEYTGRWIGMLERLLVFVAVLARAELLIGFVVAVKAALGLRAAQGKPSRALAEYYLVGSLASLSWALIIALALRQAITGGPGGS
jgi:hypothetical protein